MDLCRKISEVDRSGKQQPCFAKLCAAPDERTGSTFPPRHATINIPNTPSRIYLTEVGGGLDMADPEVASAPPAPEARQFRAEIRQLLNILAHSLYTEREIFLRELI